jgi:hypothetical protein
VSELGEGQRWTDGRIDELIAGSQARPSNRGVRSVLSWKGMRESESCETTMAWGRMDGGGVCTQRSGILSDGAPQVEGATDQADPVERGLPHPGRAESY